MLLIFSEGDLCLPKMLARGLLSAYGVRNGLCEDKRFDALVARRERRKLSGHAVHIRRGFHVVAFTERCISPPESGSNT